MVNRKVVVDYSSNLTRKCLALDVHGSLSKKNKKNVYSAGAEQKCLSNKSSQTQKYNFVTQISETRS